MLQAAERTAVERRNIVRQLAGGVGVEVAANSLDDFLEFSLRISVSKMSLDRAIVFGVQHPFLGKYELEDVVVRQVIPVNQLPHHVPVCPERQHFRDRVNGLPKLRIDAFPFRFPLDIMLRYGVVTRVALIYQEFYLPSNFGTAPNDTSLRSSCNRLASIRLDSGRRNPNFLARFRQNELRFQQAGARGTMS